MDEQSIQPTFSRREVLTGSAAVIAGVTLAGSASEAQPDVQTPNAKNKLVPVYVTDKELADWTNDVIVSIVEGLPMIKVFERAEGKTENEYLQRFSQDVPDMLLKGYVLSDLMEMNRYIFTRDYVATVRYGEIYGELDTALQKWLKDRPQRD